MGIFNKNKKEEAKKKFEKYKSQNISQEEMDNAKKKASALGELAMDFLLILQMVGDALKGRFKLEVHELAIFIGAIAYVASPIDAIPDVFPVFGMVDDGFIVTLAISTCKDALERYKKFKANQVIDYK